MATKYLSENGITQLITLIKNNFVQKSFKTNSDTNYKELTDNNLTDAMKVQYDAAYTHSQSAHAPSTAQANVIETVKVNGTALTPSEKAVDIPVPLISTDISTDDDTDLKTASPKAVAAYVTGKLASLVGLNIVILKTGEYDANTKVPTISDPQTGTFYFVPTGSGTDTYKEFIYYNSAFELIGSTDVDLSGYLKTTDIAGYTAEEVNNIWATIFSA